MEYTEAGNGLQAPTYKEFSTLEQVARVKTVLRELIQTHAMPLLIALDGSAAVGKGTVTRTFQELGYYTFSFGEFSRVLSWFYLNKEYGDHNLQQFFDDIKKLNISVTEQMGLSQVVLEVPGVEIITLEPNSTDLQIGLRSSAINNIVSYISGLPEVVEQVNNYLQNMADKAYKSNRAFISEGRDHWKIFDRLDSDAPDWYQAMLIIYLTASDEILKERAVKREEKRVGRPLSENEVSTVTERIINRNQVDSTRAIGRLVTPEEAQQMVTLGQYDAVVDSTELTEEQTFLAIALLQLQKINFQLETPNYLN